MGSATGLKFGGGGQCASFLQAADPMIRNDLLSFLLMNEKYLCHQNTNISKSPHVKIHKTKFKNFNK